LDDNFRARISGHVYAQPLYWHAPGSSSGTLFVATEDNVVHAIDAVSGKESWQRSLGKPVPRPCVIVETYKCLQIKISGVSA
jgi:outer membrane protein assembly factor BamB